MSEKISSFKHLRVYNLAFEVQQESSKLPNDSQQKSANQIRRASRSVGVNIAEALQKRRYVLLVSKLTDAGGSRLKVNIG
jgi:four helix bundle protein